MTEGDVDEADGTKPGVRRVELATSFGQANVLVGRDRELQLFGGLLARALDGDVGVGLIAGSPGSGKTRLLEELALHAESLGFAVAWGRGWEHGAPPSYWPWIEIFRSLLARPGGRDGAGALLSLLPEIDARVGPPGAPSADVFQLYDAADRYLAEAAAREPVLLVIDDLHAADASSFQLSEFVLRQRRGRRLVLLGSHRQIELRRRPELQRGLSRLARAAARCELASLSADDVAEWVRAVGGGEEGAAAQELHRISEGNPLFVSELLRSPGRPGVPAHGDLPEGIRSLLWERFALVEPSQLELLQAASVVGRHFTAALVADVARAPLPAVDVALREAADAGLLSEVGPASFRFAHALMAETLVAELSAAARAALHRRVAESLERRHGSLDVAPWNEIAHHWLAAGADSLPRAVDAATRAAAWADARLAFADAARFYEHALTALALAAPADAKRRGELLVRAAEALARADQPAAAHATCRQALELARELRDGELLARAALARGAEATVGAADEPVTRCLEEALGSLPPGDGVLRALVLARLASARQPAAEPEGPMQLARDAIAMAERLGQPAILLQTLHSALGALMDFAPATERLVLNREALRLARSLGDRPRALRASLRLAFDRVELGDVEGFEAALREHAALADEFDQPRHRWVMPMCRSMRANWEGRFSEADRLEQEARRLRDQGCDEGAALVPARPLLRALLRRDAEALSRAVTDVLTARPDDRALGSLFAALLASFRGELDVAAREVAALRARGLPPFASAPAGAADVMAVDPDGVGAAPASGYLHLPEVTSEIAWALGDRELACSLYAELLPLAGRPFVVTATAFSLHGVVDHALMRLGSLCQSPARVDAHAASALALCARLGAAPIAALVRRDWARIMLQRAPPEAAAPAPPSAAVQLQLDGDVWTLSSGAIVCRVRDTRGMQMLARLLENAGRELHVLELSGSEQGVDGGDAGEALDREAKLSYLRRLREVDAELEEASSWNDLARRDQLLGEAELLRTELSRAFGKGGRERRVASAVERARVNVRRRLTVALEHVERASPELARKLRAAVKTGVYCVYQANG